MPFAAVQSGFLLLSWVYLPPQPPPVLRQKPLFTSLVHTVPSGALLALFPFPPGDVAHLLRLGPYATVSQTEVFVQHWLSLLPSLFSFTLRLTKEYFFYIQVTSLY